MSGGYPNSSTYQPWEPRHLVIKWHGRNDYEGTPFRKFRPASGMSKTIAIEGARKVNGLLRRIMWRARKGKI